MTCLLWWWGPSQLFGCWNLTSPLPGSQQQQQEP